MGAPDSFQLFSESLTVCSKPSCQLPSRPVIYAVAGLLLDLSQGHAVARKHASSAQLGCWAF